MNKRVAKIKARQKGGGIDFESPRSIAIGKLTGGKVRRIEEAGYEFIKGELKKNSPEYDTLVGKITGRYAERLLGSGVTIIKQLGEKRITDIEGVKRGMKKLDSLIEKSEKTIGIVTVDGYDYVLSDEPIEEGGWYYHIPTQMVYRNAKNVHLWDEEDKKESQKVIATNNADSIKLGLRPIKKQQGGETNLSFKDEIQKKIQEIFPESLVHISARKHVFGEDRYLAIYVTLGKDKEEYPNKISDNDSMYHYITIEGVDENGNPKKEIMKVESMRGGSILIKSTNPMFAYERIKTGWRNFSGNREQIIKRLTEYFKKVKKTLIENKDKLTDYAKNLVQQKYPVYQEGGSISSEISDVLKQKISSRLRSKLGALMLPPKIDYSKIEYRLLNENEIEATFYTKKGNKLTMLYDIEEDHIIPLTIYVKNEKEQYEEIGKMTAIEFANLQKGGEIKREGDSIFVKDEQTGEIEEFKIGKKEKEKIEKKRTEGLRIEKGFGVHGLWKGDGGYGHSLFTGAETLEEGIELGTKMFDFDNRISRVEVSNRKGKIKVYAVLTKDKGGIKKEIDKEGNLTTRMREGGTFSTRFSKNSRQKGGEAQMKESPEQLIRKYNLTGKGVLLMFKNDPKFYWSKNLSANRLRIFVTDDHGKLFNKKIADIVRIGNKYLQEGDIAPEKEFIKEHPEVLMQEGGLYQTSPPTYYELKDGIINYVEEKLNVPRVVAERLVNKKEEILRTEIENRAEYDVPVLAKIVIKKQRKLVEPKMQEGGKSREKETWESLERKEAEFEEAMRYLNIPKSEWEQYRKDFFQEGGEVNPANIDVQLRVNLTKDQQKEILDREWKKLPEEIIKKFDIRQNDFLGRWRIQIFGSGRGLTTIDVDNELKISKDHQDDWEIKNSNGYAAFTKAGTILNNFKNGGEISSTGIKVKHPKGESIIPVENITADEALNVVKSQFPDFTEFEYKRYTYKKYGKGGEFLRKIEPPEVIEARWKKKKDHIRKLANDIHRLKLNVTRDLSSDNEKTRLVATIIAVMLKTGERIGNGESANNGHYGVTYLKKKHLDIKGTKVTLDYVGKSGVKHEKSFSDFRVAQALKQAIKNSPNSFVFTTSEGQKMTESQVNNYLKEFGITGKDIRGFSANRWILDKLKDIQPEENEKKRKKQFNKILKQVAAKVGHGSATLRKHYMMPEIFDDWMQNGKVFNIKQAGYATLQQGGEVAEKLGIPKEQTQNIFHLPFEFAVYVPSTQDVSGEISKEDLSRRVEEVKKYLSEKFGGFSSSNVEGGYVTKEEQLIEEKIVKVTAFSTKEAFDKNKSELLAQLSEWAKKWGQEAIGLEFEGDLMYVPQKLNNGGGIPSPRFSEKIQGELSEEQMRERAKELMTIIPKTIGKEKDFYTKEYISIRERLENPQAKSQGGQISEPYKAIKIENRYYKVINQNTGEPIIQSFEGGKHTTDRFTTMQEAQRVAGRYNRLSKLKIEKKQKGGEIEYTSDGSKGGMFDGPSHANNGIKTIVTETGEIIEVEGREPLLVPETLKLKQKVRCKGKPKAVVSALNEMGGGANFSEEQAECELIEESESGGKINKKLFGKDRIKYLKEKKKNKKVTHISGKVVTAPAGAAVINKTSAGMKETVVCEGTPAGIASAINEIDGNGVKFSNEGKCQVIKK